MGKAEANLGLEPFRVASARCSAHVLPGQSNAHASSPAVVVTTAKGSAVLRFTNGTALHGAAWTQAPQPLASLKRTCHGSDADASKVVVVGGCTPHPLHDGAFTSPSPNETAVAIQAV